MKVSVILPTFNEAGNVVKLIQDIKQEVDSLYEIIVVDDNSPDGTSNLVAEYIKKTKDDAVRLETRLSNPGLTNSLNHGIKLVRGDVVVWLDADFSMPPRVIPKLLEKITQGYDIAVGSRFIAGGKAKIANDKDLRTGIFLSRVLNIIMKTLFGNSFYDYTSGFIAVRKEVLDKIILSGDYGEYFIDFIIRAFSNNYKICEIPYICEPRFSGVSKTGQNLWDYVSRGKKYLWVIIKLYFSKNILRNI